MKSKKNTAVAPTVVQEVSATPISHKKEDILDKVWVYFCPVLLFLAMTAQSVYFTIGAVVVFLIFSVGRRGFASLKRGACLFTASVLLYVLVCLASGLWSDFESASAESAKILAALCVFLVVLVRTRSVRRLLIQFSGVVALIALLCIDASSLRLLSRGYLALMSLFDRTYSAGAIGFETGTRITGIYGNANVSAGLIALGLIVSVGLYLTADVPKKRLTCAILLGIQATAFFLSFSMGATAALAAAALVYLIARGGNGRLRLFLFIIEIAVISAVCGFAAYACLGRGGAVALVPLLAAVAAGVLLWLVDEKLVSGLCEKLYGHGKAAAITIGAIIAALAAYLILGFSLSSGLSLSNAVPVSRASYPTPGDYTLTYEGADAQVLIYAQNSQQLMMHTETQLYSGALSGAAFTVPEDAMIVWFSFSGQGELSSVTLSDGTALHLGYPLLPGFIANRLQGLRCNQNFIQRLVFFRDGIALWKLSPVYGLGQGGVAGGITSVQSFFYETRYIHNQFIQIMDEAGLIGLAAFVFMLVCALLRILRRRKNDDGFFAPLCACLTMMLVHSLAEVVWSTQYYQVAVFVLFVAMVKKEGEEGEQPQVCPAGVPSPAALIFAITGYAASIVFGAFLCASVYASVRYTTLRATNHAQMVQEMRTLDRLELYYDTDYKVNLMGNALQAGGTLNQGLAAQCADALSHSRNYYAHNYLALYYCLPLGNMDTAFDESRIAIEKRSSDNNAWNFQLENYRSGFPNYLTANNAATYVSGVNATAAYLALFNAGRMAPIELTEENTAFLNFVAALDPGADGQTLYESLASYLGLESPAS